MARPGVTYLEVANAASQLLGQGKNPTIEQIRLFLGTGSSTTLANHLKQWKASQGDNLKLACKENLPEELIALMKGLWEKVIDQADEKISAFQTNTQENTNQLLQELQKYKTNNHRWQQLFEKWGKENTQLQEKNSLAQARILDLETTLTEFSQKQNLLALELQEKHDRLKEFQRLHQQTQENFEHFRESSRTQRLVEQQRFEKEKMGLQTELQTQENSIKQLKQEYASQEKTLRQLEKSQDKLLEENKLLTASNSRYQAQLQEFSDQYQKVTQQIQELQTENRVLATHLTQLNQELDEVQEKTQQFEQEKWALAKEKAQLEGQIQQLQQFMASNEKRIKA